MNFNNRPTGKCFICGKSTKLNIHQECGKPAERKKKTVRKYEDSFIDYLADIDSVEQKKD